MSADNCISFELSVWIYNDLIARVMYEEKDSENFFTTADLLDRTHCEEIFYCSMH